MNKWFFNLSDGCRGNKQDSIIAVTLATNQQNTNWWIHFMFTFYYAEQSLKYSVQFNKFLRKMTQPPDFRFSEKRL